MHHELRNSTAIVLAGGLGTRLRPAIDQLPKCMAPVHGKPFIDFVVNSLQQQGIRQIIFSLGYLHEQLTAHLDQVFPNIEKIYSIEENPLGTGGAIAKACALANSNHVVALNGDTLFEIDFGELLQHHQQWQAKCTIALKAMTNFSRYGTVSLNNHLLIAFHEKQFCESGLINGGIYVLDREDFLHRNTQQKFSMEKDYLEKFVAEKIIFGLPQAGYFIDIGIPEDYYAFQQHVAEMH